MAIDDLTVTPEELPPIQEEAEWKDHLPALLTDVIIIGGGDGKGAANFQARVLDARTKYLKQLLETIQLEGLGGIFLQGMLNTEEELDDIPTDDLKVGTAWFLDFELRIWNGTEWANSGTLRGAKGLNLLGLWPDELDLPVADQNEVGDAYIWRHDLHVLIPDNTWEALGIRGPAGASTFELWVEIPGNEDKTLADFILSQKGNKGDPGPKGDDAYQTWLTLPGNAGKTKQQWAEETKGEKGDNLKILGTVANEASLPTEDAKDQDGWITRDTSHLWIYVNGLWVDVGKFNGRDGTNGNNLRILGTVATVANLADKDEFDQAAWIVQADNHLYIYIDNQGVWVDMGRFNGRDGKSSYQSWLDTGHSGSEADFVNSLPGRNGTNGRNLIIKGAVATLDDLPKNPVPTDQDAYTVRDTNSVYMWVNANWTFLGAFKGADGTNGVSFILKGIVATKDNLPSGSNVKDQDMWAVQDENAIYARLGFTWGLMGSFQGPEGKSSVQYWLDANPGKTEADYWATNKGEPGKNLQVKGTVANQAALSSIINPKDQDAYVTSDTRHLWVCRIGGDSGTGWLDLGPFAGKDGTNGRNGKDIQILGTVSSEVDLNTKELIDQTSWIVAPTGHLWTYVENIPQPGWVDMGQFNGRDGKTNYQRFIDLGGTGTEQAYLDSLHGKNGIDGRTIVVKGAVVDVVDLPTDAEQQDAYSVTSENHIYMFIGSDWVDLGGFKGTDGINGDDGKSPYQEWLDIGNTGSVEDFLKTLKGENGKSLEIIKILTEDDQTIPPANESTKAKAYVDLDTAIWVNTTGTEWVKAGKIGAAGEPGKAGASLNLLGVVPTLADLPDPSESDEGDAWQIFEDKMVYVLVDAQWNGPYDFVGSEGKQGIQGDPGATVAIKDVFANMTALIAAHPTGVPTDAYMLENGHLVIWASSINGWKDVGEFRGPPGIQGPIGEGIQGKIGKTGEQGSRWIALPSNMDEPTTTFSGRAGDWCISYSTLRVFYKTVNDGWVFWGNLVSGDVNSPPLALGKVSRLGDKWVPETIQEVPEPQEDTFYGRKKKADSETETEWSVIEFPEGLPDLTVADGKQMVRVFVEGDPEPKWAEVIFPEGIKDLTVKDGKQMVRVYSEGDAEPKWAEIVALADPTGDITGKYYVRKADTKTWTEIKLAPSDGKLYMSKGDDWVAFDRYDLAIRAASATINIDASKDQVVALDNTTATAKVISIANFSASRSTTLVVRIKGSTGAISYGGTNIRWDTRMNNGSPPELSTYRTVLIFLWDGEVWTGNMASTTNA